MKDSEIKDIADKLRDESPALGEVPVEKILEANLRSSGFDVFLRAFRSPKAWVGGIVSLYTGGMMPENDMLRLFAGVSIGAAVEAVSSYLKQFLSETPSQSEPVIKPNVEIQLADQETIDVVHNFVAGLIGDLKSEGYVPPTLDEQRTAAAYRVASRNPLLQQMTR